MKWNVIFQIFSKVFYIGISNRSGDKTPENKVVNIFSGENLYFYIYKEYFLRGQKIIRTSTEENLKK